ncbi:MAG: Spy/CpxP family protein refolding chaperone [Steroidobacteraceae bacterium]
MFTLRQVVPALCLATSLSGLAVYAATTTPTADSAGAPQWHHGHRGGGMGAMGYALHKLNLTADQKAQIKTILAGEKSQFEALRASAKENRHALATTPTTDANYPALIETAQHNAATRITLMSETWKQVYEGVLTKEQQQQIPGIVAAAEAARESKIADWKAQHPQSQ